jgi:dTDP-4-dehydrorhamnose reductase
MVEILLSKKQSGIYHVGSSNLFTPYVLTKYVLEKAKRDPSIVKKTSIESFLNKFPLRYPQYIGLDSKKTRKKFSLPDLSWEKIVEEFIAKVLKD